MSCVIKMQNGFTLWYQLTQVVLENRLLNGYVFQRSSVVEIEQNVK